MRSSVIPKIACVALALGTVAQGTSILGIDWFTGQLLNINSSTGTTANIGSTGMIEPVGIAFHRAELCMGWTNKPTISTPLTPRRERRRWCRPSAFFNSSRRHRLQLQWNVVRGPGLSSWRAPTIHDQYKHWSHHRRRPIIGPPPTTISRRWLSIPREPVGLRSRRLGAIHHKYEHWSHPHFGRFERNRDGTCSRNVLRAEWHSIPRDRARH